MKTSSIFVVAMIRLNLLMVVLGFSFTCPVNYFDSSYVAIEKLVDRTGCSIEVPGVNYRDMSLGAFRYYVEHHKGYKSWKGCLDIQPVGYCYDEAVLPMNFNPAIVSDVERFGVLIEKGYPQTIYSKYQKKQVDNFVFLSEYFGEDYAKVECGKPKAKYLSLIQSIARFKNKNYKKTLRDAISTGDDLAIERGQISDWRSIDFNDYCSAVGLVETKRDTLVLQQLLKNKMINGSFERIVKQVNGITGDDK